MSFCDQVPSAGCKREVLLLKRKRTLSTPCSYERSGGAQTAADSAEPVEACKKHHVSILYSHLYQSSHSVSLAPRCLVLNMITGLLLQARKTMCFLTSCLLGRICGVFVLAAVASGLTALRYSGLLEHCSNSVIQPFYLSCLTFNRPAVNQELSNIFNELWRLDVNRMKPGLDYTISIQVRSILLFPHEHICVFTNTLLCV